jgi:hypothetical protein
MAFPLITTAPYPFAVKRLAFARLVARRMERRIVTPMCAALLTFRNVNQAASLTAPTRQTILTPFSIAGSFLRTIPSTPAMSFTTAESRNRAAA